MGSEEELFVREGERDGSMRVYGLRWYYSSYSLFLRLLASYCTYWFLSYCLGSYKCVSRARFSTV